MNKSFVLFFMVYCLCSSVVIGQAENTAREIELLVRSEFPDETMYPEIATLNGYDVRDNVFMPGTYELKIAQPGFVALKEEVVITSEESPFVIERTLKVKLRTFEEEITFDVTPSSFLAPHKITISPFNNPQNERTLTEGDQIKPGVYDIKIEKEGYLDLEKKTYVWPTDNTFVIAEKLIAAQVKIDINISYDVPPSSNYPSYVCSIVDPKTNISHLIKDGDWVKPGVYKLNVQQQGYNSPVSKEIVILPSSKPYKIVERLVAKPRKLLFAMEPKHTVALIYKAIDKTTNTNIDFSKKFSVGSLVSLVVKFREYATIHNQFLITPGEGPFVATIPLEKLKDHLFAIRKKGLTIDGIYYPIELYADDQVIENHLIKIERGVERHYFTVKVSPQAKNLTVFAGYKYVQEPFGSVRTINRLRDYDITRLIKHLERIAHEKELGYQASLIVIEKMFKSMIGKPWLKKISAQEFEKLLKYIESWSFESSNLRIRQKTMVEAIRKIIDRIK